MRALASLVLLFPFLGTGALPAQQDAPTARIAGLVTASTNEPLPLAEVWAEVDGEVVAKSRADGAGWFLLGHLPLRRVVVRARAAGAHAGCAVVDLCEDGVATTYVRVPTLPVRTIRGIVRDMAGKPAPHAMVLVQPASSPSLAECVDRTDADAEGRFAFADVPTGPAWVRAWLPGNTVAQCRILPAAGEALAELQLDGEPGRKVRIELRGATPEQRQACVFRLRAVDEQDYVALPRPFERCQPDASGSVELIGMPPALRVRFVTAQVPGAVVSLPRDVVPRGPPEWTVRFDVLPEGEGLIRGVIADKAGNPVAGRRVVCRPQATVAASDSATWGLTDAKGRFALPAPVADREQFALRLVDEQLVLDWNPGSSPMPAWYLGKHEPEATHELTAVPASRVCVRLLDEDGLPVGGAFVRLQQDGHLLGLGGSSFEGSCVLAGLNVPAGELRLLVTTTRLRADFGPFTVTATNGLIDLGTVTLTSDATARK